MLGHLAVAAVGQATDLAGEELAAARGLAAALFLRARDADGAELVLVPVDPPDESLAEGAGVELVGFPAVVEGHGRDEEALGPGCGELAVQHEAEPARLLHAEHLQALGHELADVPDEFGPGEFPRRLRARVVPLRHGHDGLQVHVQPEAQARPGRVHTRHGQRLLRRHCGLAGSGDGGLSGGRHDGVEEVCFHRHHGAPAAPFPQPFMASNPAWRRGWQSSRPVRRVAELGVVRPMRHALLFTL